MAVSPAHRCLVPKPALAHYWSAQQEWMGKDWRSVNALGRLATIMKIRGVDVSEQPNVSGLPMCGSYAYSIFPESGRKQFKVELSLESGEGSNRFLGLSCLRHRVKLPTVLFFQSTAHGLCGFGKQKWQWAASPGNANSLRPRQYLVLFYFFSIPTWRKRPRELEKWAMLPLADSLPSSIALG